MKRKTGEIGGGVGCLITEDFITRVEELGFDLRGPE